MGPLSGGALPAPRAVALRLEIGPCAADPDAPATSRAQIAMPVWDDLLNCVCQNGPQRPGIQEVLDTLQRNTVCTGTQCFETEADAFGLTAALALTYRARPCASQVHDDGRRHDQAQEARSLTHREARLFGEPFE